MFLGGFYKSQGTWMVQDLGTSQELVSIFLFKICNVGVTEVLLSFLIHRQGKWFGVLQVEFETFGFSDSGISRGSEFGLIIPK